MNRFLLQLAILLYSATIVFGDVPCAPVRVRDCPGVTEKAKRVNVFIEGCLEEPCTFIKGRNVSLEIDVEFEGPVQKLEAQLWAIVGIPIKWDGVNPEGCEDIVSVGDCPFDAGDYVTYGAKFNVGLQFPTVVADVRYMLLDEQGETQICWIVRASVEPESLPL